MADFVLISGDTVIFKPSFGAATVVVVPGTLTGSSTDKVNGMPVCVAGDEATVIVPGCAYTSPPYTIPGVGTLSIASLAANQKASRTQAGGKAVLLKGADFTAKFQVMVPATKPPPPPPPTPDTTPQYSGSGSFVTTNTRVKGT